MSSNQTFNPYVLLGVSPQANSKDVQTAYRVAAKRFHPDTNHNPGASLIFRDINLAYEIIAKRGGSQGPLAPDIDVFTSTAIPSRRVLPIFEEPQVFYLLLEVHAAGELAGKAQKRNVNLGLVLDRSASMQGVRMERVKTAAKQVLDQLGSGDRLCIVSFSDRADLLLKSEPVSEPSHIRALINTITPKGGTEIFHGLNEAFDQVRWHYNRNMVNHLILITDGKTYGDEQQCLELADQAREIGIGISAMGIGDEWNDEFLDELVSKTGGASAYINSPSAVVRFLEDRVRTLGEAFAERLQLTVAPDADVQLESVFRLAPNAQPMNPSDQPIQLGTLGSYRPLRVLLQFLMPGNMPEGFRTVARLDVMGDILGGGDRLEHRTISDQSIEVQLKPQPEDPPAVMLDALGKLTLYRMQQKTEQAITQGQVAEATRRLQNLATRLLAMGHDELAEMAQAEAHRIVQTKAFSEMGRKTLKFGTRLLLAPPK
ncbi:MAG: VWA domain-containing protein [Anaerolineales bacterium]|nr:VWA domain-containing protein [Anaerolineales bacterium]